MDARVKPAHDAECVEAQHSSYELGDRLLISSARISSCASA
jgi:hypothetical protein